MHSGLRKERHQVVVDVQSPRLCTAEILRLVEQFDVLGATKVKDPLSERGL